jgi:hypothetical protein
VPHCCGCVLVEYKMPHCCGCVLCGVQGDIVVDVSLWSTRCHTAVDVSLWSTRCHIVVDVSFVEYKVTLLWMCSVKGISDSANDENIVSCRIADRCLLGYSMANRDILDEATTRHQ